MKPLRVVAGRHQEGSGRVGADAVVLEELGGGLSGELLQVGIQGGEFGVERLAALGGRPQSQLGVSSDGALVAGTQAGGGVDEGGGRQVLRR